MKKIVILITICFLQEISSKTMIQIAKEPFEMEGQPKSVKLEEENVAPGTSGGKVLRVERKFGDPITVLETDTEDLKVTRIPYDIK